MNKDITDNLPHHIAIIMDGNGRWAKSKGFPRVEGHRRGASVARNLVRYAHSRGIKYLTFFVFSSENWARPVKEVNSLMNMMRSYLKKEAKELDELNARLHVIGDMAKLPEDIAVSINDWQEKTKNNDSMHVIMALSYGGRQEIVDAVKRIVAEDIPVDDITEDVFASYLDTKDIPEPDLLIRTSGEQRISNFLLWQLAYTEMYFTNTYWPDFDEAEFEKALANYAKRERRYGAILDIEDKKLSGAV